MTLVQRVDALLQVWKLVLPHIPAPAATDATRWLNYPDSIVEQAIFRTGKKFLPIKLSADLDPAQAYRYATATARTMAARAQEDKDYDTNNF
jgi:hypothetical protein